MNNTAKNVFNSLLAEIADRKLGIGDSIPTEKELASRFKTGRANARMAVRRLEERGLVKRNKKQGTTILKPIQESTLAELRNIASSTIHIFTSRPLPDSYTHWDESTLFELESALNENGVGVSYGEMPPDKDGLKEALDEIGEKGSMGVIFFPGRRISALSENSDILMRFKGDIFIFNAGNFPHPCLPCHSVSLNPYGEGLLVGNYLRGKGYGSTAFLQTFVEGAEGGYWSERRWEGLRRVMLSDTGGGSPPDLLRGPHGKIASKAADYVRRASGKPALVAQNDLLGARVIDALVVDGLVVGTDYGLVGFDNDMRYRNHNMTTVAPPVDKIGGILADLVLKRQWARNGGFKVSIEVESRIIVRTTCA
jgi:DNA-binding LacI/PurR family transcriptional regulator